MDPVKLNPEQNGPLICGLADDLTGVCDTGAQFSMHSITAWGSVSSDTAPPNFYPVIFFNTQTRCKGADQLKVPIFHALSAMERYAPGLYFKKVDTGLRGHIADEMAMLMEDRFDRCLFMCAIPGIGRTTIGAKQCINGVPITQSDLTQCRVGPDAIITSDIISLFKSYPDLKVRSIALSEVRSPGLTDRIFMDADDKTVIVFDAETDEDIAVAVRAALPQITNRTLFVGSLGLAQALARMLEPIALADPNKKSTPIRERALNPIVVCGSPHTTSQKQLKKLINSRSAGAVFVDPTNLQLRSEFEIKLTLEKLDSIKRKRQLPVIALSPMESAVSANRPELSLVFAQLVRQAVDYHRADGLLVVGGETAYYICQALDVQGIEIHGAVEVVAAIGRPETPGRNIRVIVTKGGTVGSEDVLVKILEKISS